MTTYEKSTIDTGVIFQNTSGKKSIKVGYPTSWADRNGWRTTGWVVDMYENGVFVDQQALTSRQIMHRYSVAVEARKVELNSEIQALKTQLAKAEKELASLEA